MRLLIYGAGVLGSLYAARLQAAGHPVALLARGQRLANLRAHGIVLEDARTGERTTTNVEVVEQLASEDAYDLIIVLMRKNQIDAILPALAANRHTPWSYRASTRRSRASRSSRPTRTSDSSSGRLAFHSLCTPPTRDLSSTATRRPRSASAGASKSDKPPPAITTS